jgi:hypothetical protein
VSLCLRGIGLGYLFGLQTTFSSDKMPAGEKHR